MVCVLVLCCIRLTLCGLCLGPGLHQINPLWFVFGSWVLGPGSWPLAPVTLHRLVLNVFYSPSLLFHSVAYTGTIVLCSSSPLLPRPVCVVQIDHQMDILIGPATNKACPMGLRNGFWRWAKGHASWSPLARRRLKTVEPTHTCRTTRAITRD